MLLDINKPRGLRFVNCQFVKEGSPTDYPIELDGCYNVQFLGCWFEGLGGNYGVTVPAYIRIGKTMETRSIVLRDSILTIGEKYAGGIPHCNYFVEIVRGTRLLIDEVVGFDQNLKKLIAFSGASTVQDIVVRSHISGVYGDGTCYDNLGTGRAALFLEKYNDQGITTNGSFVHAYRKSNQSIAAATWTRVTFDTIANDELLEFDAANNRFVAKYTGIYEVLAYVTTDQQPDGNRCRMAVFKNTTAATGGTASSYIADTTIGAKTYGAMSGKDVLKLNTGDYIDIRVFSDNAITIQFGAESVYFKVRRVF